MYIPSRFNNQDTLKSLEIIRNNPFATLISLKNDEPFVSHLPLVLEQRGEDLVLIGHLANANPHVKLLATAYVVFHGPHTYITPTWYTENDVPTWNYATVHIKGVTKFLTKRDEILDCLKKLTVSVEPKDGWQFFIPEDLQQIEKMITGFEITITSLQAKFKLSQNRSVVDQKQVIAGLGARGDEQSLAVRDLMLKNQSQPKT